MPIGNLSRYVVSETTPGNQLIDPKTGYGERGFVKFLQGVAQSINGVLDILGVFQGVLGLSATVQGHPGTLAQNIQHLSGVGVIQPGGINFSLTAPTFAQVIGTAAPAQIPPAGTGAIGGVQAITPTANEWVDSINTSGVPHLSQPAFSNISGTATAGQVPALSALSGSVTAGQVPALSALSGQITTGQLPASGLSVTIVTAQLTTLGAQGSMTFTNGILTAQTPAT